MGGNRRYYEGIKRLAREGTDDLAGLTRWLAALGRFHRLCTLRQCQRTRACCDTRHCEKIHGEEMTEFKRDVLLPLLKRRPPRPALAGAGAPAVPPARKRG